MNVQNAVQGAQGGAAIANLATAFGVSPDKTAAAVDAMVAELTYRIERKTMSRGGIADVVSLLGKPELGGAISDPTHVAEPAIANSGDQILDVLIGNKHISRGIADQVSRQTGIDAATLKQMLPVVASMLMGGLQAQVQTAFSQKLRDVPGLGALLPLPGDPPPRRTQSNAPTAQDYEPSSQSSGNGNLRSPLPRTSGGSNGGFGGATGGGGVLLPLPGDTPNAPTRSNRYDDLSDVVRKGGTPAPGGGSLENMIRSILGGLLGFKNRGVISSLIYMFVVRWLMNFGRRILSRVLLGR